MPRFIVFIFAFLLCLPAHAEDAKTLAARLKAEQAVKDAKASQLQTIEKDLEKTSGRLVDVAGAVQKSEKTLAGFDARIKQLETEEAALRKKLAEEQGSLSRLLTALERLRRMPPEAMIVQPGLPLKTAQSAMLMRDILPGLQQQANALKDDLKKLAFIAEDLRKQKEEAQKENRVLTKQQNDLDELLHNRKTLYASAHKDFEAQSKKVEHISAQSRNLSELVQKLQAQKEKDKAPAPQKQARAAPEKAPKDGSARLPVSGVVVTAFNAPDDFGAPSQGIDIEGREGALVVAPMGGIVRFAGHFKNYGNMVILEHEKGWHSLIAGLEKIDTVVGQSMAAGEPLGVLHKTSSGRKPRLYYELRQNGKAVNPARKFADLS